MGHKENQATIHKGSARTQRPLHPRPQSIQHQSQIPPPISPNPNNPHQHINQRRQIPRNQISTNLPTLLPPPHHRPQLPKKPSHQPINNQPGIPSSLDQRQLQLRQPERSLQDGDKPVPGIRISQRKRQHRRDLRRIPPLDHRHQQLVLTGKPPIKRGHPNPGPPSDLLQRHLMAHRREGTPSSLDDPLGIARRIGPQRPSRSLHVSTVTDPTDSATVVSDSEPSLKGEP